MEVTEELLAAALRQAGARDCNEKQLMALMQKIRDERDRWVPGTLYSTFVNAPPDIPNVFLRTEAGWYSYLSQLYCDDGNINTAGFIPCGRMGRGDAVDRWLKRKRDAYGSYQSDLYGAVDNLLNDYRLHCDTGTPLDREAHGC